MRESGTSRALGSGDSALTLYTDRRLRGAARAAEGLSRRAAEPSARQPARLNARRSSRAPRGSHVSRVHPAPATGHIYICCDANYSHCGSAVATRAGCTRAGSARRRLRARSRSGRLRHESIHARMACGTRAGAGIHTRRSARFLLHECGRRPGISRAPLVADLPGTQTAVRGLAAEGSGVRACARVVRPHTTTAASRHRGGLLRLVASGLVRGGWHRPSASPLD